MLQAVVSTVLAELSFQHSVLVAEININVNMDVYITVMMHIWRLRIQSSTEWT